MHKPVKVLSKNLKYTSFSDYYETHKSFIVHDFSYLYSLYTLHKIYEKNSSSKLINAYIRISFTWKNGKILHFGCIDSLTQHWQLMNIPCSLKEVEIFFGQITILMRSHFKRKKYFCPFSWFSNRWNTDQFLFFVFLVECC